MHELQKKIIGIYQIVLFIIFSEYTSFSLDTQNFYYALYKKIIDFRHAEFISASLRLKEVLKQVQDDEVIFAFFVITLYQYFSLKETFIKKLCRQQMKTGLNLYPHCQKDLETRPASG